MGATRLTLFVCEEKAPAQQVRALFRGNDGSLMRACINVPVHWKIFTAPVLFHAASTDGISSDTIALLINKGGAHVDGQGDGAMTPLMAVIFRNDEQTSVEVARGKFVLLW